VVEVSRRDETPGPPHISTPYKCRVGCRETWLPPSPLSTEHLIGHKKDSKDLSPIVADENYEVEYFAWSNGIKTRQALTARRWSGRPGS
jgi:hypothetical protein